MADIVVREAQLSDVGGLAPLFDAYRQFYEQPSDMPLAQRFLTERLAHQESVILVAENQRHTLVGFCQLYPTFCSILAAKTATLYDLYVAQDARKSGTGKALLLAAHQYAITNGYARLDLTTAKSNTTAQRLYESLNWMRDDLFYAYNLAI